MPRYFRLIYLATERTGDYQKDQELAHKQGERALLEGKPMLRLKGSAYGNVPASPPNLINRSTLNLPDFDPSGKCAFVRRSDAERQDYSDSEWQAEGKRFLKDLTKERKKERKRFRRDLAKALAKGIIENAKQKSGLMAWGGEGNERDSSLEYSPEIQEAAIARWGVAITLARPDIFRAGCNQIYHEEKLADAGHTKQHVGEIEVGTYGRISVHEFPAIRKDHIEPLDKKDVLKYWKELVRQGKAKSCASCPWPLLIEGKKSGARKRHKCCEADGRKADKRKYWHGPKHTELLEKKREIRQAKKSSQIEDLTAPTRSTDSSLQPLAVSLSQDPRDATAHPQPGCRRTHSRLQG